jgi:hypothetical protein
MGWVKGGRWHRKLHQRNLHAGWNSGNRGKTESFQSSLRYGDHKLDKAAGSLTYNDSWSYQRTHSTGDYSPLTVWGILASGLRGREPSSSRPGRLFSAETWPRPSSMNPPFSAETWPRPSAVSRERRGGRVSWPGVFHQEGAGLFFQVLAWGSSLIRSVVADLFLMNFRLWV